MPTLLLLPWCFIILKTSSKATFKISLLCRGAARSRRGASPGINTQTHTTNLLSTTHLNFTQRSVAFKRQYGHERVVSHRAAENSVTPLPSQSKARLASGSGTRNKCTGGSRVVQGRRRRHHDRHRHHASPPRNVHRHTISPPTPTPLPSYVHTCIDAHENPHAHPQAPSSSSCHILCHHHNLIKETLITPPACLLDSLPLSSTHGSFPSLHLSPPFSITKQTGLQITPVVLY